MSTAQGTVSHDQAVSTFDATTARWGRLTMTAGMLVALSGPLYLMFFSGLEVDQTRVWAAFLAIAGTFAVLWVVEPVTYFPILGQASMYQVFMIGNISNKLLPAAMIAQAQIGAKTGTRRGELAAVMAISGAVVVHLTSLLLLVGILGSNLVAMMPEAVLTTIQTYVLPAVLGAVLVQAIVSQRQPRTTVLAAVVASVVVFVLVPLMPALAFFGTALAVFVTAGLAWLMHKRGLMGTSRRVIAER